MSAICDFLQRRLDAGEWNIGQVLVRPGISLCHAVDVSREDLDAYHRAEDAREIAKYDAKGNYRPLKTAPNLRRGWRLFLPDVDALRLALDLIYPAVVGTWLAEKSGTLKVVPLRETLARQTGMYRVTRLIRDEQAAAVIARTCEAGCLKSRRWEIAGVNAESHCLSSGPKLVPLLCAEACNLLVAACRPIAKENLPKDG